MIIFSSSTVHPLQYFLSSPILARLALKIKTRYSLFNFHQGLHPSLPPQVHSDLRQSLRRHPVRSSPWQVLSSQQRHGLLELLLLPINPACLHSRRHRGENLGRPGVCPLCGIHNLETALKSFRGREAPDFALDRQLPLSQRGEGEDVDLSDGSTALRHPCL